VDRLLADPDIEIVINLTVPQAHAPVDREIVDAGKHVYSEKPLAMSMREAHDLCALARERGLQISSAPCGLLGETAQTLARALRDGVVGRVRVVYAEMDDGLVHRMPYRKWLSDSGVPWPHVDEFEVGCTLEHAGYCVPWLAAFFGPAVSVTAFASVQIPDKAPGEVAPDRMGPDLSVACIQFASGVVARLTCSVIATHDHRMRIFGDDGVLWTDDTWHYRAPVYLRRFITLRRRMLLNPLRRKLPLAGRHLQAVPSSGAATMDFLRGVAELADAVREGRPSRLSTDFSLHVNEISLAIHEATGGGGRIAMTTSFEPPAPMPWAA
jgi:predicted dehydrogenase